MKLPAPYVGLPRILVKTEVSTYAGFWEARAMASAFMAPTQMMLMVMLAIAAMDMKTTQTATARLDTSFRPQSSPLRLRGGEAGRDFGETVDAEVTGDTKGPNPPQWLKDLEAELRKEVDADGKPLSKNELKRRLRAAQKEREKQEKMAAAPAAGAARSKAAEEDLDPNQYFEHRCAALQVFKDRGGTLPYSYDVTRSLPAFRAAYEGVFAPGGQDAEKTERLAGRIMQKRVQGKLAFYELSGGGAKVQIMASEATFASVEDYAEINDFLRRGDVVGVEGYPGVSKSGELSIMARRLTLLAPCLRMIPKLTLTDPETRCRQRYLDLMINPHVAKTFQLRRYSLYSLY